MALPQRLIDDDEISVVLGPELFVGIQHFDAIDLALGGDVHVKPPAGAPSKVEPPRLSLTASCDAHLPRPRA